MEQCWHCKSVEFYFKRDCLSQKYFINCDVIHNSEHKYFIVYTGNRKVIILDDVVVEVKMEER